MIPTNPCSCGSESYLGTCCLPYIQGKKRAPSAEKLMRSRFTAYTLHEVDYLYQTTHVSQRRYTHKSDILAWSNLNTWQKLEILNFSENTVEFKAYYLDENKMPQVHHEKSTFNFFQEEWFYVDGKFF